MAKSKKKIIALVALGLVLVVVLSGAVLVILVGWRPAWYRYENRSSEDLLAAKEWMIRTGADFANASQVDEEFILELGVEQINDMLAVLIARHRILPSHIAYPVISFGDDAAWAGASVTWKGQTSVVSVRLKAFVDSAGLLHMELDQLRAGALGLPDDFLPQTLDDLEQTIATKLAASKSDSDQAKTARKNKDLLDRIFTALTGVPVPASFVTREDLQMAVEDIRISPGLLEIQFRPIANETPGE